MASILEARCVAGSREPDGLLVGRLRRQQRGGGAIGAVGWGFRDVRRGGAVDRHGVRILTRVQRQRLWVERPDVEQGGHGVVGEECTGRQGG